MFYSLSWLALVLRKASLKVVETPGWQTCGHGDFGTPKGILLHHTACGAPGAIPDLQTLIHGRSDLPGPICNLGLARDGTYYVVAAGKAWHAGLGEWQGVTDGNGELIGIEAENNGTTEVWPEVQMTAYICGVAALLNHISALTVMCAGHKEYALPRGRKIDPDFDMNVFRLEVENARKSKEA